MKKNDIIIDLTAILECPKCKKKQSGFLVFFCLGHCTNANCDHLFYDFEKETEALYKELMNADISG